MNNFHYGIFAETQIARDLAVGAPFRAQFQYPGLILIRLSAHSWLPTKFDATFLR